MIKINKTYQVVTEESASNGDFAEGGFEYEDRVFDTIEDAVKEILTEGFIEPSASQFHDGIWYTSADPVVEYSDGSETTYSFHVTASPAIQRAIFDALLRKCAA